MAYTDNSYFNRNYNATDTMNAPCAPRDTSGYFPNLAFLSQWSVYYVAPEGYHFKEWNSARDGSGVSRQPTDRDLSDTQDILGITQWYAIWLADNYIASGDDITLVANAIREKTGDSASLEFPDGFVTAISSIPSGGGGESMIVTFTENDGTWTADKTAQEIYEAYEAGIVAVGCVSSDSSPYHNRNFYPLTYAQKYDNTPTAEYSARFVDNNFYYDYSFQSLNWIQTVFYLNRDWQGDHVRRDTDSWQWM